LGVALRLAGWLTARSIGNKKNNAPQEHASVIELVSGLEFSSSSLSTVPCEAPQVLSPALLILAAFVMVVDRLGAHLAVVAYVLCLPPSLQCVLPRVVFALPNALEKENNNNTFSGCSRNSLALKQKGIVYTI